jgi:TIR domain
MKRAFLSHSSIDKPIAEKIYTILRNLGIAVWLDKLEMRPGDYLTDNIQAGIKNADFLIVLVTEDSNKSRWVELEISIAQQNNTTIIPLVLNNCIPQNSIDKLLFIDIDRDSIDIEEKWTNKLISAIYRDSYILELYQKEDLVWDDKKLEEDLHKYYRNQSNYSSNQLESVRVYIAAGEINKKLVKIAERAISQPDIPQGLVSQVKQISDTLPTKLPIFWVNLADLTGQTISYIFQHYGKNDDAVKIAKESTDKILEFANYTLWRFIHSAIFATDAEQFGCPQIAAFINKYAELYSSDEEQIVREICSISASTDLIEIGLEGKETRSDRIWECSIFLPSTSETDRLMLQLTCKPSAIITDYAWFQYCVPQIAAKFLSWTAFREGKPIHELGYTVGICMDDYEKIGLY